MRKRINARTHTFHANRKDNTNHTYIVFYYEQIMIWLFHDEGDVK